MTGSAAPADAGDAAIPVAELFTRHRLDLVRLAVFLTGDRAVAEDLVQDAFAELHRRWATLRDPSAAIFYLRRSIVNSARSGHRRAAMIRRTLRVAEPDDAPAADYELLLSEEHREVLAALHTLPPRQREVLVLRYWTQLSEADIAQTLGISRGTVKSTAARGLEALRRVLEVSS